MSAAKSGLVLVLIGAALAGCASNKESAAKQEEGTRVALADLPAPARASVERVTAGGKVDKITRETEKGTTVYDVEATVHGQHQEFLIADADGAVLGTEMPVAMNNLPPAVRAAAEAYFDKGATLKAMKGVEYGETSYEVEGMKGGKTVEATFDTSGKMEK